MLAWVRATVTTALVLTCLDGQAKVAGRCVQTLEAAATPRDPSAQRPCPLAIGYAPRRETSATRLDVRRPGAHLSSRRAGLFDAVAADAKPIDEVSALHG